MQEKLELTAIEIELNFITVDNTEILSLYDFQTVYVCTMTARFRRKQLLLPLRLKYVIKKLNSQNHSITIRTKLLNP